MDSKSIWASTIRNFRFVLLSALLGACDGGVVEPGGDSGGRDGGVDSGLVAGDAGEDRDGADGGSTGDAGSPEGGSDAGALPAYCPALPAAGPRPVCPASPTVVEIAPEGDVELRGDQRWTCDHVYHLRHTVFLMEGTLTIEAGTRIVGDRGAALVITQHARIEAIGHPEAPIVFTSSQPEGARAPGDWGGVVLLGDAPINTTGMDGSGMLPPGTNAIEGLPATDLRGRYGGTDAAHDCGTIRWARIEYAGYQFGAGNELNGLTLGGCGSETEIELVQVHLGLDDGFEMFGGSPNLRFVIATAIDDDGLDWDLGFTGTIQFAVVDRLGLPSVGSGDPNGIEGDNHPHAFDNVPRSNPDVWNVTLVGERAQSAGIGMVLRRGTYGSIGNAIVIDWPRLAVNVRDVASISAAGRGLTITNSLFFRNGPGGRVHFAYGVDLPATPEDDRIYDTVFDDAEAMNRFDVDPRLGDISGTPPRWVPPLDLPVVRGGGRPPAHLQSQATFIGAFGPGCPDWSAGWTAYP
jgi:hypothetical protein